MNVDQPLYPATADTGYITNTSCAFLYTNEALQHNRSVPNSMTDIIGMQAVKNALVNLVLSPQKAPQHFIIGAGNLPKRTNLMIYGADQSGKNTLVKAFCGEYEMNMIFVSYAGLDVVNDMPLIYATAQQHQPCIVLWDDCVSSFKQRRDPKIIGTFRTAMQIILDRNFAVWNVFTTVEKPFFDPANPESLHYAFYGSLSVKIWAGAPDDGRMVSHTSDMLTEADRRTVFIESIRRYYTPIEGQPDPYTVDELTKLVDAAVWCTAGNIINFVDSVFLRHSDRIGLSALVNLDTNDPSMIPTFQTFEAAIAENLALDVGGRVTPFNPHQVNIEPYTPPPPSSDWD